MSRKAQTRVKSKRVQPAELSEAEALAVAIHAHRVGELDGAETLYRRILEGAPEQADALHFLGVLLHNRGKSDAGIELIRKSIVLGPDVPGRHNNLGNALVETSRLEEALDAYRQAIMLAPGEGDAYNNLGAVLRALKRFDEAAEAYQKAITLNPGNADVYNNMGNLMAGQGRVREAVAQYCKAITLMPGHKEARKLLGIAYYTLGQTDAAAEVYRDWVREEPDNPVARHHLAACLGEDVPPRASDDYVERTFDGFAASFDAKLGHLGYRAPQLVADALARCCGEPAQSLSIMDAGCGTGLCGPLIAPYANRLVGVDLSGGMLARARARNVYDELVKAELTACLESRRAAFDAIVSADTLVYFGALDDVLTAARNALRAAGLLIFTVEVLKDAAGDPGYRINPHGRYSHGRAYVERTLARTGFDLLALEPATLRNEGGNPVEGFVVSCRAGDVAMALSINHNEGSAHA